VRRNPTRKRKKLEIDVKDFGVGRSRANLSLQQGPIAVQHGADPETIRSALCHDADGTASGPLGVALVGQEK
jgi:hypothetical protein